VQSAATKAGWLLLCCACGLGGCSSSIENAVGKLNDTNIKRIANLYTAFQNRNGYLGPKDEAMFKSFITKQMAAEKLTMMGVDRGNIDEHFVSERDGKPFKIKYGLQGGLRVVAPVVFEEEGVGGRRQIGSTNSVTVEDADRARYEALWNQKSAPAPAPVQK
jgi:hypothetical protein